MEADGRAVLRAAGVSERDIALRRRAEMRYVGQGHEVEVEVPAGTLSVGASAVLTAGRATPAAGYIGCCHAIPKINLTDRLKELHCPALVIVGEEDPGTPVAMARDIQAALPGAQLAILRSASHLSNVEQPEEFTRVLLEFLDKASGKSAR